MEFTDITAAGLRDRTDPHPAVSTQVVYHGAIWDVQRERFSLGDDGQPLTREFIDHPGSVAVLALDEQERVLLINQYRHPVGLRMWEIPAGLLDEAGEAPHAAAQRELGEETDLRAEQWHTLVDFHNSPGSSAEANRVFLARGLCAGAQELEPSEQITVHRLPLAEARAKLVEQECGDGQSLAALVLLDRWLGRGNRL